MVIKSWLDKQGLSILVCSVQLSQKLGIVYQIFLGGGIQSS